MKANDMKNSYAIDNLQTLANNIAPYASYYDRSNDKFGEIDELVTNAEKAVLELVNKMRALNDLSKLSK